MSQIQNEIIRNQSLEIDQILSNKDNDVPIQNSNQNMTSRSDQTQGIFFVPNNENYSNIRHLSSDIGNVPNNVTINMSRMETSPNNDSQIIPG